MDIGTVASALPHRKLHLSIKWRCYDGVQSQTQSFSLRFPQQQVLMHIACLCTMCCVCRAEQSGGAIKIAHSSGALLENCLIDGNAAAFGNGLVDQGGGGVAIVDSDDVLFDSCVFVGNTAGAPPGSQNSVDGKGGGMRVLSSDGIVIRHTVFLRNKAQGQDAVEWYSMMKVNGGGIHLEHSDVNLDTCTLTQNAADKQGGGIWGDLSRSTMVVRATLLSANAAMSGAAVYIARAQAGYVHTRSVRVRYAPLDRITRIFSSCIIDNQVRCSLKSD